MKKSNFLLRLMIFYPIIFFLIIFFLLEKNLAYSSDQPSRILRDALGYEFPLGPPPQRIISLAPNLTEILFELNLGEKIIGLTRFCNYPPQATTIERVGGYLDPNLEKITALNPDLVLAYRGTPLDVLNKLRTAGLPLFVFDEGQKIEDLFSLIETLGLITRREGQALKLIQNLRLRLLYLQAKIKSTSARPKVFLTLSGLGLWTCGQQSFLHHLIEMAGGVNIAAFESRRWFFLRTEDLIQAAPDIIVILAPDSQAFSAKKNFFLKEPSFKKIKAIQDHYFGWLQEDEASRFGPRLIKALEELARLLHPEVF
ncbi:MAG: ABC transporter substrate-binding protein [Candidatus Aminicenantes bacterium]|nr:ABC transporter substrate-binding protein [Candidatus Aminicenantes bacterium]